MGKPCDLEGKFAIVSGAVQGIGQSIAELLIRNRATVVSWDLKPVRAVGLRASIVDLTDPQSIREALADIGSDQRIDMQFPQADLPIMLRQRSGRIVRLGSLAGKEGLRGLAVCSAASAGVIAFTKVLSREVTPENVFLNCVAPGPIETNMIRSLGPDVVTRMIRDGPMGRLGQPEELANMVAWLCSEASCFNSGAVFYMSGCRARHRAAAAYCLTDAGPPEDRVPSTCPG